ncbi:MAG: GntR family transcriptional regulator [Isosphaeraceae bacterium]
MAEPMYRQIAEDLRRKIESGELAPGGQLPTENELMEQYSASRNTVRDAIKWLATRGSVETRPGQGTFVTEKIDPFVTTLTGDPKTGLGGGEEGVYIADVEAEGRTPAETDPRVQIRWASKVVTDALQIEEGARVVSRHQQRLIDGTPWSLQTSYYPMRLVDDKHALGLRDPATMEEGGAVTYLAGFGITQVGYRDTIAVRAPDETETAFFKLPADGRVSVFEILRVAFDQNGDPFRFTITVYPADRNQFVINVGDVPPHCR